MRLSALFIVAAMTTGCVACEPDLNPQPTPEPVPEPTPEPQPEPTWTCEQLEALTQRLERRTCEVIRSETLRDANLYGVGFRIIESTPLQPETAEVMAAFTSDFDWSAPSRTLTVLDAEGEPIEADPFDFASYFVDLQIARDVDFDAMLDDRSLVNTYEFHYSRLGPLANLMRASDGEQLPNPIVVQGSLDQLAPILIGLDLTEEPVEAPNLGPLARLLDLQLAAELRQVEELDEMTLTYVSTAEPSSIAAIQQGGDGPVELRRVDVEHPTLTIDVDLARSPEHEWFRCMDGDATYRFAGPAQAEFRRVDGEVVATTCEL